MSIRRLKARLTRDESGLGIVEVLAAFMIFSVIAVGMAYSLVAMTRLTADATHRQTATNLAASEIDRVLALSDAFNVHDATSSTTIAGIVYTVTTSVGWISAGGASGSCGTGGGNLQYKRVNVTVSWPGMYLKNEVRADSALAPASRINDPAAGTILVSVIDVDGVGNQGVTVTATKTSGGTTITGTIDPTDVDGCTYILKAPPGNYDVSISKTGHIDTDHVSTPVTRSIVVAAGAATPVQFSFDKAGAFTLDYAANSTRTVTRPNSLKVTYSGHLTDFSEDAPAGTRKLFPWAQGYQVVAGEPGACLAVDPENWDETETKEHGVRASAVSVLPGDSGTLPVPMGVVELKMPSTDYFVTAVQQSSTSDGNPGCASSGTAFTFAKLTKNKTYYLALPYGTWGIHYGTKSGSTSSQFTSQLAVVDGVVKQAASGGLVTGLGPGGSVSSSGVVTLDPRQAK